jgi:hypothetical protein
VVARSCRTGHLHREDNKFADAANDPTKRPEINREHREAHQSLLREARLTLTEGGLKAKTDRHAIANIVGPIILCEGGTECSPHRIALRQMVTTAGLISARLRRQTPDAAGQGILEDGSGLHILLLDDQAKHGWVDWLREALPGARIDPEVDPTRLATEVVSQLEAKKRAQDWNALPSKSRDLRFTLRLPGFAVEDSPVLLLDLRLFSGNPDLELAFYNTALLPLVERFTDQPCLSWPGFSTENARFVAARKVVASGRLQQGSAEHHELLTWFARSLALADMSLPIVLFSSTGQRDIVRRFADYGNIITRFAKPRFVGATDDSQAITDSLRDAIQKARRLLKARHHARESTFCTTKFGNGRRRDHCSHFEIYIDETHVRGADEGRTRDLVVGGIIAGFASEAAGQEFDDRLVTAGVRYFSTFAGPRHTGPPLAKRESCQRRFESVVHQWRRERQALSLSLIVLKGIEPFRVPLSSLNSDFMDIRWRMAVDAAVEVFLTEFVPALSGSLSRGSYARRPASVSVYAPTRVALTETEGDARRLQNRFGTRIQRLGRDRYGYQMWGNNMVAESDAFNSVRKVFHTHRLRLDLAKAKHVRLVYDSDGRQCKDWEIPATGEAYVINDLTAGRTELQALYSPLTEWRASLKALHYVCDWVLRDYGRRSPWPEFDNSGTIEEPYSTVLHENIEASRFLDQDRLDEALGRWRRPSPHGSESASVSAVIGARIGDRLDDLSGRGLLVVCDRLDHVVFSAPASDDGDATALPPPSRFLVQVSNLGGEAPKSWLVNLVQESCWVTPLDCDLADDPSTGARTALLYFDDDAVLPVVVERLNKAGMMARAMVTDVNYSVATGPDADSADADIREEYKLLVTGIPSSLPLHRVRECVKQRFPAVGGLQSQSFGRGTTKYNLHFGWPASAGIPDALEPLVCGSEELDVEFVTP